MPEGIEDIKTMPIKNAQGMYGGYRAGQKDAQTFRGKEADIRGKEISNAQANAEFIDYLDARESRVSSRNAQMSKDRTTTETESSRTKSTRQTNKADTRKADSYLDSADKQDELLDASLDRQIGSQLLGVHTDKVDAAAQIFGSLGEEGEAVSDENYSQAYQQAAGVLGEEFLESLGIGGENTPKAQDAMKRIRKQAVHSVDTQVKEHTMRLKNSLALDIAGAESGGRDPESVLGKMIYDRDTHLSNMAQSAPGSYMYKLSEQSYQAINEAIGSYQKEKGAIADEKEDTNFSTFLANAFPLLASDLEGDAADTEASNRFINSVYTQLRSYMGADASKDVIRKHYVYESNRFSKNGFKLKSGPKGTSDQASIYADIESIDDTMRYTEVLRNLGKSGREILREQALKMEKEKLNTKNSRY